MVQVFLWEKDTKWKDEQSKIVLPVEDPEIKTVKCSHTTVNERVSPFETVVMKFSDWIKIKRIISYIVWFIENCRSKGSEVSQQSSNLKPLPCVEHMVKAETLLIKIAQEKQILHHFIM